VLNARVDLMSLMLKAEPKAGSESQPRLTANALVVTLKDKMRFLLTIGSAHGSSLPLEIPWGVSAPMKPGSFMSQISDSATRPAQQGSTNSRGSNRVSFSQRATSFDENDCSQELDTQPIVKSISSSSPKNKKKLRGELLRAKSVGYDGSVEEETEPSAAEGPAILSSPSKSMLALPRTSKQLLGQV
jgi:hypothetical protein